MKEGIKMALLIIGAVIAVLLGIALALGITALVWWGIGSFVVWAFGFNFLWTFWHGLAVALVVYMIAGVFSTAVNKD